MDFVLNDLECAIEAKSSANVNDRHLRGLRELKIEHPKVKSRLVVSTEARSRVTEDGIRILSVADFVRQLWAGELIQ